MKHIGLTAIIAFFFAAAAHAATVFIPIIVPGGPAGLPPAKIGNYDNIHSVAIISGLASTAAIRGGPGIFVKKKEFDIQDWKLDEYVVAAATDYLRTRFVVKSVKYDPAALRRVPDQAWYSGKNAKGFLSTIPHEGVDAFVSIRAVENGLSLQLRDQLPSIESAQYQIEIIDVRKWELVANIPSQLLLRVGAPASFPIRLAGPTLNSFNDFVPDDKQRMQLQSDMLRLVSTSLVATLRAAKLGIELPPPDARKIVAIPQADDPFPNIKTVAVVSTIGDQFEFRHLGFSIFSNSDQKISIADWNLDDEIEAFARKALKDRFTVKDISFDRAALRGASLVDAQHHYNPSFPGLSASPDVDAFIVFVKHPIELLSAGAATYEGAGVGMWNHGSWVDAEAVNQIYAHYAVVLIDAHTLKPLATAIGTASPKYAAPRPRKDVDKSLWTDKALSIPPNQREEVHRALIDLLPDGVEETLLRMDLTGMTIDDMPPMPSQVSAP